MSDVVAAASKSTETKAAAGQSPFMASWRRYNRNKLAIASTIMLMLIVLACFGGPLLFPYGPEDYDFENISAPVNLFSLHPFGTDDFGRDLLLLVLTGGRVSLAVGFVGAFAAVIIGVIYGAAAGYVGGRLDNFLMRTVDVLYGIPYFFLVVLINLWVERGTFGLLTSIIVVLWLTPAVIARGQAVSLRHREFVDAARAGGMTEWQIIFRHILPNVMGPVVVMAASNFASAILTEAGLSFLGIGAQPPIPSWGEMINAHHGYILMDKAYLAFTPGIAIMILVLSFMMVGNGLRDALDSRMTDDKPIGNI